MTLLADVQAVHEDADLLVLQKPAGLLCVPGRGPRQARLPERSAPSNTGRAHSSCTGWTRPPQAWC